ncbi:hypothetical protein HK096_010509 [Nowakowskiella sp. JEL0078]|nr:hypothetical protein HK096_010509 [Nowakowskiella sp. JEL0078]
MGAEIEKTAGPPAYTVGHKRSRKPVYLTFLVTFICSLFFFSPHFWMSHNCSGDLDLPEMSALASVAPPPIQYDEFLSRQSRLVALLKDSEIDAFISEPGTGTTKYLFGQEFEWSLSERPFLFVVTEDGTIAIVYPKFEETRVLQLLPKAITPLNYKLLPWEENSTAFIALADFLSESLKDTYQVSVDPNVRGFILSGISLKTSSTNVIAKDGNLIIRQIRMHKSTAELALLKQANVVTKAAIATAAKFVRVGTTEDGLRNNVLAALRAGGLINVWAIILFGDNAAYPHGTNGETKKLTSSGSVILVDAGGELYGYQSDITRSWWFNGGNKNNLPPLEVREVWGTVREAQKAAIAKAKIIGSNCDDVDSAARSVISSKGFGEGYQAFTHRLGHGIGLEGHEEPYLTLGNSETKVAAGQTFTVEPGIYIPGKLGIRLEDVVVIREHIDEATGDLVRDVEIFGAESESIDEPFKGHL